MADIINFKEYIELHEEDRKRLNKISMLSTKNEKIEELLHNISNNIRCSITTMHLNEMNQVIKNENVVNDDLLDIIINSLKVYSNKIHEQINDLKNITYK